MNVEIIRIQNSDHSIPLPHYETSGSAGADLRANFLDEREITLAPFGRALIPTGLMMAIPDGYEGQIRPRSGLAAKYGITIPNSPGTVDSDYRGEVKVILMNMGSESFNVEHGMRIAQMIIAPVIQVKFSLVSELITTSRDGGGFGSTGVK